VGFALRANLLAPSRTTGTEHQIVSTVKE